MTEFYVAGKFKDDLSDYRAVVAMVQEAGHELTCDWSKLDVWYPYHEHSYLNEAPAATMLDAASTCDVLVLIHGDRLFGAMIELGAALSHGAKIVVVGDGTIPVRDSAFFCLPSVVLLDDLDELRTWIGEM